MAVFIRLPTLLGVWGALVLLLNLVQADAVDDLAAKALTNVYAILDGTQSDGATHTTCTRDKLIIRREWGNFTTAERTDYIKAVLCIQSKPTKYSTSVMPGARNRYDDFVGVHINQTMSIHNTANFLSWHRYFTWQYEQALRNECGYTGAQPYWGWNKYSNPMTSPIFDGSDTSMGGNGEKVQHAGSAVGGGGVVVPAGQGGGCVRTGPFKDMQVNLGPVSPSTSVSIPRNPQQNGYGYNPRCLRRDVSDYFTTQYLRTQDVANLITSSSSIADFQGKMQTDTRQAFGVHSAGHFTIWGDPGGDFYTSPGDPAFWLHHGMIDRTWWIWQNQQPSSRVVTIAGGTSMFGGAQGKLTDIVDLGVVGQRYQIRDLVSTTAGPFCYVYA
ncbi:Di-copper centre-containing protein [Patellaria atrata CBS 101060]|uniref:Di-copper centre-containing protein n=1 Tax=Patellaria atrata CBS 101060 TaxID=1346257 RepID=A0A9P4SC62_9PEZI|nr:Di-copper centre-containing protein [Patellaria atrata CBS 101060]